MNSIAIEMFIDFDWLQHAIYTQSWASNHARDDAAMHYY